MEDIPEKIASEGEPEQHHQEDHHVVEDLAPQEEEAHGGDVHMETTDDAHHQAIPDDEDEISPEVEAEELDTSPQTDEKEAEDQVLQDVIEEIEENVPEEACAEPDDENAVEEEVPEPDEVESDESLSEYAETELDVEEYERYEELTQESVYRNACSREGIVPSKKFLRSLSHKRLSLSYSSLGPVDTKCICETLKMNASVEAIDLKNNSLGDTGIKILNGLFSECRFVTDLDLQHNQIGLSGLKSLANILENLPLKKLNIGGNNINEKGIVLLLEPLKHHKTLSVLNLTRNSLGDLGGRILAPVFSENNSLTSVDLSWNHLRQQGGVDIASSFCNNSSVTHLDLSWNGLANEGAAAFAETLKSNTTLEVVRLDSNRIETGAIAIAKVLHSTNRTVSDISFAFNSLPEAALQSLTDCIKENTTIKKIDLNKVPVIETIKLHMLELTKPSKEYKAASTAHNHAKQLLNRNNIRKEKATWLQGALEESSKRLKDAKGDDRYLQMLLNAYQTDVFYHYLGPAVADLNKKLKDAYLAYDMYVFGDSVKLSECFSWCAKHVYESSSHGEVNMTALVDELQMKIATVLPNSTPTHVAHVARYIAYGGSMLEAGKLALLSHNPHLDPHTQLGEDAGADARRAMQRAGGFLLMNCKEAYMASRQQNPRNPVKCVTDARDMFKRGNGVHDFDPTLCFDEMFIFDHMMKAYLKSFSSDPNIRNRDNCIEAAERVYKMYDGRREGLLSVFTGTITEILLAKKELAEKVVAAMEQIKMAAEEAQEKVTDTLNAMQDLYDEALAKGSRPDLKIRFDEEPEGYVLDEPERNPIHVLLDYIEKHHIRIVDLFNKFDIEKKGAVTPEQFEDTVDTIGVTLSKEEIKKIISIMDTNGDGSIDYSEFSYAHLATLEEQAKLDQEQPH